MEHTTTSTDTELYRAISVVHSAADLLSNVSYGGRDRAIECRQRIVTMLGELRRIAKLQHIDWEDVERKARENYQLRVGKED